MRTYIISLKRSVDVMKAEEIWIFGYGSLIWDKSGIQPIEEKIGELQGWHRDWTWISKRRHGAPTCSLQPGGKVKGIFLKLNPKTRETDLEILEERERSTTRKVAENVSGITGKIYFWTMGSNLEEYDDTKGLKGLELYKALARRAKKVSERGPDGKTAEEYTLAVYESDPDDEITKMYVDELRKLSKDDKVQNPTHVIQTIGHRIESLKGNRNFFTALFSVESIILTILLSFYIVLADELWVSIICLFFSLIFALLGIYSLTDSMHFYSKYIEYRYAWSEKVHGDAYKSKTSEEKATGDLRRALEADDVGYYYLKLSLMLFLWFLASVIFVLKWLDLHWRILGFLLSIVSLTFISVITYKCIHQKPLLKAFKDFFIRKAVFRDSK